MLRTPFHWPQNMPNESEETNIVKVQEESQGAIEFAQAEEREMYIGSVPIYIIIIISYIYFSYIGFSTRY